VRELIRIRFFRKTPDRHAEPSSSALQANRLTDRFAHRKYSARANVQERREDSNWGLVRIIRGFRRMILSDPIPPPMYYSGRCEYEAVPVIPKRGIPRVHARSARPLADPPGSNRQSRQIRLCMYIPYGRLLHINSSSAMPKSIWTSFSYISWIKTQILCTSALQRISLYCATSFLDRR